MRNMSFFLTTEQYRDGSKDLTRRQGWWFLEPDDQFMGVVKGQGIPKGGKIEKLHSSTVIGTRMERIEDITPEDVIREGFPGKSTEWFVKMYCKANKVEPWDFCNRIEFKHDD